MTFHLKFIQSSIIFYEFVKNMYKFTNSKLQIEKKKKNQSIDESGKKTSTERKVQASVKKKKMFV